MIDNVDPTSQFHPYQPETSTPQVERPSGLSRVLEGMGIDKKSIDSMASRMNTAGMRDQVKKARTAAGNNGGLVLGGLAALVIGAGLLRRRNAPKKY